ncbi:MAG: hypothetical protein GY861_28215, partial [bacterium]|nr:hypothetical protein [bacterium]
VDCEHRTPLIYLDKQGYWRTDQGSVHVSEVPVELIWKKQWEIFTFSATAVFHKKLAGLSTTLMQFRAYYLRLRYLEHQTDSLVNYTVAMSLSPDALHAAIEGAGKGLGDLLEGAGLAIEHVIGGIFHGAANFVNTLLSGPLQLIINILVAAAVIFAAVFLVYLLIKWFLSQRRRKRTTMNESKTQIEMPVVSRYLEPLDIDEFGVCEEPAKILHRIDKSAKSPLESKLRIEIDPPEQQSEPEYLLEKWPPERCQIPEKSTKHFLPEVNLLPRYTVEANETTSQKPVTRLDNQVKRLKDRVPIKAFNL